MYRLWGGCEAPLWQDRVALEAGADIAEGFASDDDSCVIGVGDLLYDRASAAPCCGLSPVEHQRYARQKRAVPMLLQHAPEAFERIVLAVVRRQIKQFDFQPGLVTQVNNAFHELRS